MVVGTVSSDHSNLTTITINKQIEKIINYFESNYSNSIWLQLHWNKNQLCIKNGIINHNNNNNNINIDVNDSYSIEYECVSNV